MANIELMRLALKEIEREPETWDQSDWHCGTSCCFAGKVAMISGATWLHPLGDDSRVLTPDGRIMTVSDYAIEAMETNDTTVFPLFYSCGKDFDRLTRIVDGIEQEQQEAS